MTSESEVWAYRALGFKKSSSAFVDVSKTVDVLKDFENEAIVYQTLRSEEELNTFVSIFEKQIGKGYLGMVPPRYVMTEFKIGICVYKDGLGFYHGKFKTLRRLEKNY